MDLFFKTNFCCLWQRKRRPRSGVIRHAHPTCFMGYMCGQSWIVTRTQYLGFTSMYLWKWNKKSLKIHTYKNKKEKKKKRLGHNKSHWKRSQMIRWWCTVLSCVSCGPRAESFVRGCGRSVSLTCQYFGLMYRVEMTYEDFPMRTPPQQTTLLLHRRKALSGKWKRCGIRCKDREHMDVRVPTPQQTSQDTACTATLFVPELLQMIEFVSD